LRDTLSRRCVFLFNGFYEWKNNTPFFVQRNGSEIMMLAGLYDVTKHPENGTAYMCTVVTVNASECVKCLHHRMPGVY
jgi:putative SOS response-associated peptidase YedK